MNDLDLQQPIGLLAELEKAAREKTAREPKFTLIPKPIRKAIQRTTSLPNPGDHHHLPPMAELEKFLYKSLDLENFYEALIKHAEKIPQLKTGEPLTKKDLQSLDAFVHDFFFERLPETERWIARGFVLSKYLEQQPGRPIKVEAIPTTNLAPAEKAALDWAKFEAAKNLRAAAGGTVTRAAEIIAWNVRNRRGARALRKELEKEVFEDDGEVNRNWKRVAITESNRAMSEGYIAQIHPYEWVAGFSFPDACVECLELIDGKVYIKIDPKIDLAYGDKTGEARKRFEWIWDHCIWTGKDNIGRSRSLNKQTPNGNVKREHHELISPSIPLHPYCRCRWVQINPETQYIDNGLMKIRLGNEKAWETWHTKNEITSIHKKVAELFSTG